MKDNLTDLIFNLCAAVAMVSMTIAVLAMCIAAVYGMWRMLRG